MNIIHKFIVDKKQRVMIGEVLIGLALIVSLLVSVFIYFIRGEKTSSDIKRRA